LTGGKHPFGDYLDERRRNVCDGHYFVYNNHPSWKPSDGLVYITIILDYYFLLTCNLNYDSQIGTVPDETERNKVIKLIRNMTRFYPSERISTWKVLEDEFFYPHQPHYNIYEYSLSSITSDNKPGLCVIISQEKFEMVSERI